LCASNPIAIGTTIFLVLKKAMLFLRPPSNEGQTQGGSVSIDGFLTLSFEDRRKSRLRTRLDDGREVAVLLDRGEVLYDGNLLVQDPQGLVVQVKAAAEIISVARTTDSHQLTRAAYHLGNRHVPLQIGSDWLAYPHDHVLDGLVRELGLTVATECRPFEPEPGGYGKTHGHTSESTAHNHSHAT
jgi:urease accessory protein